MLAIWLAREEFTVTLQSAAALTRALLASICTTARPALHALKALRVTIWRPARSALAPPSDADKASSL